MLNQPTLFALLLVFVAVAFRMVLKDPYGLYHLTLNQLPGESRKTPKTEWLNQGYWKDASSFPQACRALALKLVEAAKLKAGDRVLDVGHGTGESLITLLSDAEVPRPSSITGVTSLASHHNRSKDRISLLQSSDSDAANVRVDLYHGDAVRREGLAEHPLNPLNTSEFDAAFALDCAFHFVTRREFLAQVYQKLSPGGRVALGDMCFTPSALTSQKTWLVTSLLGVMPKENIISPQEYHKSMEEIGYTNVVFEDITPHVFPGILNFYLTMGLGWRFFGKLLGWYINTTQIRYVIVSGQRPIS